MAEDSGGPTPVSSEGDGQEQKAYGRWKRASLNETRHRQQRERAGRVVLWLEMHVVAQELSILGRLLTCLRWVSGSAPR